jgi:hypothetical protein
MLYLSTSVVAALVARPIAEPIVISIADGCDLMLSVVWAMASMAHRAIMGVIIALCINKVFYKRKNTKNIRHIFCHSIIIP